MGLYDQRVTGKTQPGLSGNYARTGNTVSRSPAQTSIPQGYAQSQGMSFTKGQFLRGEVIDLRNDTAKIQLPDQRILSGTLDSAASISIGDIATFQVVEASPSTVMLRVLANPQQFSQELTIDKALEAANLPKTDRNINAVRELMNQGMSIDKNSIQNLLRQSAMFRGVSFQTLTLLAKHHLPLTEVNTTQMENYLNYEHRIISQTQTLVTELTDSLAAATEQGHLSTANALNQQLLHLLTLPDPLNRSETIQPSIDAPLTAFDLLSNDDTLALLDTLEQFGISEADAAGIINGKATLSDVSRLLLHAADTAMTIAEDAMPPVQSTGGAAVLAALTGMSPAESTALFSALLSMPQNEAAKTLAGFSGMTPGEASAMFQSLLTMTPDELDSLLATLTGTAVPEPASQPVSPLPYVSSLKLSDLPLPAAISQLPAILQTPEILNILNQYSWISTANLHLNSFLSRADRMELANHFRGRLPSTIIDKLEEGELDTRELLRLLAELPPSSTDSGDTGSRPYRDMLYQALLSHFTLRPEQLTQKDALELYYKTLDFELSLLEKSAVLPDTKHAFQDTAAAIRDNIDFIKTINQIYPYIQLPLKLSGQNVHAELYVYPDAGGGHSQEQGHSVLLHLDMDQLGPMDVHLQLVENRLAATFYLPDNDGSEITIENLPLLKNALEAKGYLLSARVERRTTQSDLIQDFIDGSRQSNSMKRYTFDIRA